MSATTSQDTTSDGPARRGGRIQQVLLVLAMVIGSVAMWAGSPALWIWIASNMSSVSQTAMSSLLVVLIGIPVTMIIIGKGLARLDNRYSDLYGQHHGGRGASAARWLHSARGGGDEDPPTMLDKVMVASVGLAMLLVGIWFVFFSAGTAFRGG